MAISLLRFIVRNIMRISFIALLVLFVASHTLAGFAVTVGGIFASLGVQTVTGALEARAQLAETSADASRAKTADLEARNRRLSEELDRSVRERKVLQGSLDEATAARKAAEIEAVGLRKRASMEVDWKGKKTTLKAAVFDVTKSVKKRTGKVAATNSASIFGEGIPFFGVGIIVASLGYELKTACDTMREMDDLEKLLDPDALVTDEADKVCGMKIPTKEEVWQKIKDSPQTAWSSAIAAYDGALESVPSWEEVSSSSADALAWSKSAVEGVGSAISDGAVAAGDYVYDAGAAAVEGVGSVGASTVQGAKELWEMECWFNCN